MMDIPQNGVSDLHTALFPGYSKTVPAKSSIELSRVKFKGAFRYNESSNTYYRVHDPAEPQYIGPPSPEIDKAWEDLLDGT